MVLDTFLVSFALLFCLVTPADSSIVQTQDLGPLTEEETISMRTVPYRVVIGCLLWLSLGTRPDITYAVSQVAKFSANPGQVHWKAVKRILRYLHSTRNMGLIFRNLSPTSEHIFPHVTFIVLGIWVSSFVTCHLLKSIFFPMLSRA